MSAVFSEMMRGVWTAKQGRQIDTRSEMMEKLTGEEERRGMGKLLPEMEIRKEILKRKKKNMRVGKKKLLFT